MNEAMVMIIEQKGWMLILKYSTAYFANSHNTECERVFKLFKKMPLKLYIINLVNPCVKYLGIDPFDF